MRVLTVWPVLKKLKLNDLEPWTTFEESNDVVGWPQSLIWIDARHSPLQNGRSSHAACDVAASRWFTSGAWQQPLTPQTDQRPWGSCGAGTANPRLWQCEPSTHWRWNRKSGLPDLLVHFVGPDAACYTVGLWMTMVNCASVQLCYQLGFIWFHPSGQFGVFQERPHGLCSSKRSSLPWVHPVSKAQLQSELCETWEIWSERKWQWLFRFGNCSWDRWVG